MIRFEEVTKIYEENKAAALFKASFHIPVHSFTFLTGESGAGKTTLLKLIIREELPEEGRILVNGQEIGRLRRGQLPAYRRTIGCVFQDFRLLHDRSVYENIALARRVAGVKEADVRNQVLMALKLSGLMEEYDKLPCQLSGGQQQKVCIARAMVGNPQLLLADEPTGNLDPASSREIMQLLELIHLRGTTVLVATHDRAAAEGMDYPRLRLSEGRLLQ